MTVKFYKNNRDRRHARVRGKIKGSNLKPRLSVFRSSKHIYAQLIDDRNGQTLASASDLESGESAKVGRKPASTRTEIARKVGKALAEKALAPGIKKVVFDRGGYKYHGRVKALAEGAREGGLEF